MSQDAAAFELVAIALYESECRPTAREQARRTVLSRVRAHYDLPSWTGLTPRERARRRTAATGMIAEHEAQQADARAWEEA